VLLACLSDGLYALGAGSVRAWLARDERSGHRLERLSGSVYVGLGAVTALSGARPSSA
jgi:threonine/homoserine/homoserine lactone efflux protein